jgi:hypothetical protein
MSSLIQHDSDLTRQDFIVTSMLPVFLEGEVLDGETLLVPVRYLVVDSAGVFQRHQEFDVKVDEGLPLFQTVLEFGE